MNTKGHLERLSHIRSLLTHPAIDQDDINRRLLNTFVQVEYARHHYHHYWDQLIRATRHDDPNWFNDTIDNRFVDLKKFGYPPDHRTQLGRCNFAGKAVFYCSSENGVPIFEVRPQIGQTLVLSTWVDDRNRGPEIDFPIWLDGFVVGVEPLLATLPDSPMYAQLKELLLKDDLFNPAVPTPVKEIDSYVGKLFSEPYVEGTNLYRFTSSVAQLLLTNLDCLLYPSVESRISGYNLAIHKEIVDNRLRVYGAAMYTVVGHDPTAARYVLKPVKSVFMHPTYHKPVWRNVHSKHDDLRFIIEPSTPTVPYDPSLALEHEDFPF